MVALKDPDVNWCRLGSAAASEASPDGCAPGLPSPPPSLAIAATVSAAASRPADVLANAEAGEPGGRPARSTLVRPGDSNVSSAPLHSFPVSSSVPDALWPDRGS